MIAENISHEMFVDDDEYDNVPGYTYNVIKFDEECNGVKQEVICKYAKKEGEFGVIPEILNDLLTERKAVRKLAEAETDEFMKAVYEGRQLALKLTANSLYGQIGAGTSPVCYVRLAASTTAVGRGQIMIAKNFVEQDFKNTLMYIYENKDNKEKLHEFLTKNFKNKAGKTLADDEKEVNKVILKVTEVFDKYDINPKVVYGDSVAHYTPILIKELVELLKFLVIDKQSGIFNISNSERITKYDFGLILAEKFLLNKNLIRRGSINDVKNKGRKSKAFPAHDHNVYTTVGFPEPSEVLDPNLDQQPLLSTPGHSAFF